MQKGQILMQGTPQELMQADVLETIYGVPMEVIRHPAFDTPVGFAR